MGLQSPERSRRRAEADHIIGPRATVQSTKRESGKPKLGGNRIVGRTGASSFRQIAAMLQCSNARAVTTEGHHLSMELTATSVSLTIASLGTHASFEAFLPRLGPLAERWAAFFLVGGDANGQQTSPP